MTDRTSHPERQAKKTGAELLRLERRAKVVELLATGRTQKSIAEEIGISVQTVRADLDSAREEWTRRQADGVAGEMMAQDLQTARLLEVWLPLALQGDVEASKRAEAVLAYRNKLLGLEKAPPQLHAHVHMGVEASRDAQEAINRALSRLTGESRDEAIELLASSLDPDATIDGEATELQPG